jgi:hypothetical protein
MAKKREGPAGGQGLENFGNHNAQPPKPPALVHAYLRNVPAVFIEDLSTARNFKTWAEPPGPRVRIFTTNNSAKRIAA